MLAFVSSQQGRFCKFWAYFHRLLYLQAFHFSKSAPVPNSWILSIQLSLMPPWSNCPTCPKNPVKLWQITLSNFENFTWGKQTPFQTSLFLLHKCGKQFVTLLYTCRGVLGTWDFFLLFHGFLLQEKCIIDMMNEQQPYLQVP